MFLKLDVESGAVNLYEKKNVNGKEMRCYTHENRLR